MGQQAGHDCRAGAVKLMTMLELIGSLVAAFFLVAIICTLWSLAWYILRELFR